jgi:hypothetical protein
MVRFAETRVSRKICSGRAFAFGGEGREQAGQKGSQRERHLRSVYFAGDQGAGWNPTTQIRREVTLTPGPVIVRGNMASRNKKKKKFADYILYQEHAVHHRRH